MCCKSDDSFRKCGPQTYFINLPPSPPLSCEHLLLKMLICERGPLVGSIPSFFADCLLSRLLHVLHLGREVVDQPNSMSPFLTVIEVVGAPIQWNGIMQSFFWNGMHGT